MSVFTRLECGYRAAPIGIAVEPPVLSWQGGAAEVRIFKGYSRCFASRGMVESPFRPDWRPAAQSVYRWVLSDGTAEAASSFETAFEDTAEWPARWLAAPEVPGQDWKKPVCQFKRIFDLPEVPARMLRLYVAVLGVYRVRINGVEVADSTLAPGALNFYHRTLYQTYNVEGLLNAGENILTVEVASGWHSGAIARANGDFAVKNFPSPDALRLRLDAIDDNGGTTLLSSDETFLVSNCGPWLYSDIYMGEYFDATREFQKFRRAEVFDPAIRLDPRNGAAVRRMAELAPLSVKRHGAVSIVDFGQNIAGRERLMCDAPRGTKIVIRHGEMLEADGTLYTANLRRAEAMTTIIAPGGEFTFEPEFTFYGFRYLEIGGVRNFTVRAVVLHSDLALTGNIKSDHELVNRLFANIQWGQRGNFLDIPTDCPQRDERHGWLGDAQVFIPAALYNMHAASFFGKWLDDVLSSRNQDGCYPAFAPISRQASPARFGISGWSDAGVVCPAQLYLMYGDRTILERHAPAIYQWLDWQCAHSDDGLCRHACFGDWLNLNAPTSVELVSTAYFAYGAGWAAKVADALGDDAAAARMSDYFNIGKAAFRRHFVNRRGELKERTQCAAALALHFGLLDGGEAKNACAMLADDIIRHRNCHLSTGFLGTPVLLHALSEHGELDLAYRLLEQTTYPGWLYPVTQGATTIWERWNSWNSATGFGDVAMNSFNHYAYGAVADWLYMTVGGIRPRWATPGFREFELKPRPGGSLRQFEACYDSPVGMIRSAWRRAMDGGIEYEFQVPEGSLAHLDLADGRKAVLPPGTHVCGTHAAAGVALLAEPSGGD